VCPSSLTITTGDRQLLTAMLDDEIVCLGSRSATGRPLTGERDKSLDLRPELIAVVGIVMHVEGPLPYSMHFRRADTSVVQIGRRSGYERDGRSEDDHTSAMFRCAVVSRKHAKIAFSDSGHVRCRCLALRSMNLTD